MLVYEDQDGRHEITVTEAIATAKRVAAHKSYEYATDMDALYDFIVTNWAWYEEKT